MSFVSVVPELVVATAADLASIGSALDAANAAAAAETTGVLAAGADEVSAAIAALFGA
ncbi:PE family protein, partial [Mycobacterium shinjukuense]